MKEESTDIYPSYPDIGRFLTYSDAVGLIEEHVPDLVEWIWIASEDGHGNVHEDLNIEGKLVGKNIVIRGFDNSLSLDLLNLYRTQS